MRLPTPAERPALRRFADAILAGVRNNEPDLTQRQLAVMLTIYLEPGPHTVRGLAAHLTISRTVISRALNRLAEYDFAHRKVDMRDRRSVFVQRTVRGAAYVRRISAALAGSQSDAN
jgi:DNA-binding MarR family transcriptional regulator